MDEIFYSSTQKNEQLSLKVLLFRTWKQSSVYGKLLTKISGKKKTTTKNKTKLWTSMVVQWLKLLSSTAGAKVSIPGYRTKILHASIPSQKTRRKPSKTETLIEAPFETQL